MSYYGNTGKGQRLERTLPNVNKKTVFILCVVTAGIFIAYGTGRWTGKSAERKEIEQQEVRYEPLATVENCTDCDDGQCTTGIREKGRSILSRLRRR